MLLSWYDWSSLSEESDRNSLGTSQNKNILSCAFEHFNFIRRPIGNLDLLIIIIIFLRANAPSFC